MDLHRLSQIGERIANLRVALVGDLCLDRYFEIDPGLQEISIETNLPVHNVVRVRCQPGASGTILNNLLALGVREVWPVAVIGQDGEGYELRRALERMPAVRLNWLVESPERRTFTYSKPLLMRKNAPPEELSRLDTKNWTSTPESISQKLVEAVRELATKVDAMILLDQVDVAETGVITARLLDAVREVAAAHPNLLILADSRRSLRGWPRVALKMNAAELGLFFGTQEKLNREQIREKAGQLARSTGKHVFVTMSENGMVGASGTAVEWAPALPLRGPIDIVGAGDAVTANLTAALSAGATLREALAIAQLAASIVVHQLGTTGTASVQQIAELMKETKE